MVDRPRDPARRDFLKSGLLAAAGTALAGSTAAAVQLPAGELKRNEAGIPVRPFGKTGHVLPILGMGGSAFVRMFIQAYGVPLLPMDQRVEIVKHAYNRGIRYFDTARVYGESESIVGQGLKGVRDDCYVATKCHTTEPGQVRASVEKSLSDLGMDYVDCVQIHSPAIERVGVEGAMKIHAELVKLRDEGLLRFIGLTTHVAFKEVHELICTDGFDQVLLAYGYFRKGMDTMLSNTNLEYRELCLSAAHERNMAIVAMKVMGANILSHNSPNVVAEYDAERRAALPAAAIRWVMQDDRVSMLNIGVSMTSDIDQNLATLQSDLRYTNEDAELLADFCRQAYESAMVKEMELT